MRISGHHKKHPKHAWLSCCLLYEPICLNSSIFYMFKHEAESTGYGTSCGLSNVQVQYVSQHYRSSLWRLCVAILAPVFYSPITFQSHSYYACSCDYSGVDHLYL